MQPAAEALLSAANAAMPRFVEAAVRGDKATIEEMLKDASLPGE